MRWIGALFWDRRHGRLALVWRLTLAAGWGALLYVALKGLWTAARPGSWGGAAPPRAGDVAWDRALDACVAVVAVWTAGRVLDRRPLRDFGLRVGRRLIPEFALGCVFGALPLILVTSTGLLSGWVEIGSWWIKANPRPSWLAQWMPHVFAWLGVALAEEVIFRGYLLKNLAEGLARLRVGKRSVVLGAVVVSTLLFLLAHADRPIRTQFEMFLGTLGLAVAAVMTRSLAFPIGMHFAWNLAIAQVLGFAARGAWIGKNTTVMRIWWNGPGYASIDPVVLWYDVLSWGAHLVTLALLLLWFGWRRGSLRVDPAYLEPEIRPLPVCRRKG